MTKTTKKTVKKAAFAEFREGGGVIAISAGGFPLRVPRTVLDKFYRYLETGAVQ